MKFKGITLAVVAMMSAVPAMAQDNAAATGAYLQIDAGLATMSDVDVDYNDGVDSFGVSADLKNAFVFGGALGYDFGTVRTELQLSYARNKVESLTVESINGTAVTLTPAQRDEFCDYLEAGACTGSGATVRVADSRLRQLNAMVNGWFDIPTGSPVTPYVGGGVGATGFELDGEGKVNFAWQVGGGVSFDLSETVSLSADVRHRQVSGGEIDDGYARVGKIKTTSFSAGLRFRF